MRTLFRSYTFRWWQLALYELALLSLGLGLGALWHTALAPAAPWLLMVFVLIAPYIVYLYLEQLSVSRSQTEADRDGSERKDDGSNPSY